MCSQGLSDQEFFLHFFAPHGHEGDDFQPLKEKFKAYSHPSKSNPKSISDINYVRKYYRLSNYMSFVTSSRPNQLGITDVASLVESIYELFTQFIVDGGWKIIKNKSLCCRLQEYLLLRLSHQHVQHKNESLDKYVLAFFFTLNYLKTCNHQIKLFVEFLEERYELDMFFVFIVLRKKSRRVGRDLFIETQYLEDILAELDKGSTLTTPKNLTPTQSGIASMVQSSLASTLATRPKEIKLLLCYYELMQYIAWKKIVLHEVLIFNLMKCAGVIRKKESLLRYGGVDWREFMLMYFEEICSRTEASYRSKLVAATIEKNLALADRLLTQQKMEFLQASSSPSPTCDLKEQYLQQSFSLLINDLEQLFTPQDRDHLSPQQKLYQQLQEIYEYEALIVNRLLKKMFTSQSMRMLIEKYSEKLIIVPTTV